VVTFLSLLAAAFTALWIAAAVADTSLCADHERMVEVLGARGLEEVAVWVETDGSYRILFAMASGAQWVLVAGWPNGECTMREGGPVRVMRTVP
jgi:coenzyme F420-reducing hydrogenase delta subunit